MDWLDSLIMGIVQGLSEYLPISSSGHLQICEDILGLKMAGAESVQFTVALHVATVLSTIVILWKEFVPLLTSFFGFKRDENTTYVFKILVSCVPIMIVGLFFKDSVEALFEGSLLTVGIALCVTACLLTFAYYFRRPSTPEEMAKSNMKPARDITFVDAFVIGLSQAVAVIPGLSRSGTTIATGLLLGDKREEVAKFSFFMVIIPILGEALLDLKDMIGGASDATATTASEASVGLGVLLIGFISAFVVGCLACKWMLDIVKKGKLVWFAVYCLIAGMVCIFF